MLHCFFSLVSNVVYIFFCYCCCSETAVICSTPSAEPKRRKSSQETAEKLSNKITEDDLTTEGEPSSGYWKALAEKRRIALDISLKENEELHERIASLEEELEISRALTEESKNLVEVLTEMIQEADPANDSGLPNNINGNFSRGNFDTDSLTDETGDETHDEGAITDDNTAHDDHITDGKSE